MHKILTSDIEEFEKKERILNKTLSAKLYKTGEETEINIQVIAPSIRSSEEISENINHCFFYTVDNLFINTND